MSNPAFRESRPQFRLDPLLSGQWSVWVFVVGSQFVSSQIVLVLPEIRVVLVVVGLIEGRVLLPGFVSAVLQPFVFFRFAFRRRLILVLMPEMRARLTSIYAPRIVRAVSDTRSLSHAGQTTPG